MAKDKDYDIAMEAASVLPSGDKTVLINQMLYWLDAEGFDVTAIMDELDAFCKRELAAGPDGF